MSQNFHSALSHDPSMMMMNNNQPLMSPLMQHRSPFANRFAALSNQTMSQTNTMTTAKTNTLASVQQGSKATLTPRSVGSKQPIAKTMVTPTKGASTPSVVDDKENAGVVPHQMAAAVLPAVSLTPVMGSSLKPNNQDDDNNADAAAAAAAEANNDENNNNQAPGAGSLKRVRSALATPLSDNGRANGKRRKSMAVGRRVSFAPQLFETKEFFQDSPRRSAAMPAKAIVFAEPAVTVIPSPTAAAGDGEDSEMELTMQLPMPATVQQPPASNEAHDVNEGDAEDATAQLPALSDLVASDETEGEGITEVIANTLSDTVAEVAELEDANANAAADTDATTVLPALSDLIAGDEADEVNDEEEDEDEATMEMTKVIPAEALKHAVENDVSMEMTTVLPAMLPAATADETTVLPALADLVANDEEEDANEQQDAAAPPNPDAADTTTMLPALADLIANDEAEDAEGEQPQQEEDISMDITKVLPAADSFPHAEAEQQNEDEGLEELAAAVDDTRASLIEEDISMEMTKVLSDPLQEQQEEQGGGDDTALLRLEAALEAGAAAQPPANVPAAEEDITMNAKQALGDKTFAFVYGNGARPSGVSGVSELSELNLTETFNGPGVAPLRSPDAYSRPSEVRPSLAMSPGAAEQVRTRALNMVRRSMGGAAAGRPSLLASRRSSGKAASRLTPSVQAAAPAPEEAGMVTPVDEMANGDNAETGGSEMAPPSAELFAAAQQAAQAVVDDDQPTATVTQQEVPQEAPTAQEDMLMAPLASPGADAGASGSFAEFCRLADVAFLDARRATSFGGAGNMPSPSTDAPASLREALHLMCLSAPMAESLEAQRDALEVLAAERKAECRDLEAAFSRGDVGAGLASELAWASGEPLAALQARYTSLKDHCRTMGKLGWKVHRQGVVADENARMQEHIRLLEEDLLLVQQSLVTVQKLSLNVQSFRDAARMKRAAKEERMDRKQAALQAKEARMARLAEVRAENAARREQLAASAREAQATTATIQDLEAERQTAVATMPKPATPKAATPRKTVSARLNFVQGERLRALEDVQILENINGWKVAHLDGGSEARAIHLQLNDSDVSVSIPLSTNDDAPAGQATLARVQSSMCTAQRQLEALNEVAAVTRRYRKYPWVIHCEPMAAKETLEVRIVCASLDTLKRCEAVVDLSQYPVGMPKLMGAPACTNVQLSEITSAVSRAGRGPLQVDRLVRAIGHALAGI